MNKSSLIGFFSILVIGSLIVAGILLVELGEDNISVDKLYTFPISVEEKTFLINVRSNYSSAPEVSYFGLMKSVSIDFRGECHKILPYSYYSSNLKLQQGIRLNLSLISIYGRSMNDRN